jgi:alkylation response protein AidB-like acyl-CoA dehydrogenase
MGGSAMVMKDGEMVPSASGLPEIRCFILPADRVSLEGNWDVMGLRGTGSFDFEVPEQHVPAGMTFLFFEPPTVTGGAIYGLGPIVLGTISSVAWALGVAKRAFHEIVEVAKGGRTRLGSLPLREQERFQRDLGFHVEAVRAARLLAVDSYTAAVEAISQGEAAEIRDERIRATKAAASYVPEVAKAAVTFAYEAAGSHGMRNPSRLQRCFRDIYVGAAHQVFDERNYIESAKSRLGFEPGLF